MINKVHQVNTQFNVDKSVSRQCSWFCHLVCNNINNLIDNFGKDNFTEIYQNILQEATEMKRNSSKYEEIETLFSPQILKVSKYKWDFYKCEIDTNLDDILSLTTNYKNSEEIKKTKLSFPNLSINELMKKINSLDDNIPVIINRYYQSFVLVKNKSRIIIFDSHYDYCGTINQERLKEYILYDDYSYNLITIGFVY